MTEKEYPFEWDQENKTYNGIPYVSQAHLGEMFGMSHSAVCKRLHAGVPLEKPRMQPAAAARLRAKASKWSAWRPELYSVGLSDDQKEAIRNEEMK